MTGPKHKKYMFLKISKYKRTWPLRVALLSVPFAVDGCRYTADVWIFGSFCLRLYPPQRLCVFWCIEYNFVIDSSGVWQVISSACLQALSSVRQPHHPTSSHHQPPFPHQTSPFVPPHLHHHFKQPSTSTCIEMGQLLWQPHTAVCYFSFRIQRKIN